MDGFTATAAVLRDGDFADEKSRDGASQRVVALTARAELELRWLANELEPAEVDAVRQAIDERLAQLLREDLAAKRDLTESFFGNAPASLHRARTIAGLAKGLLDADESARLRADLDARQARLLALQVDFVSTWLATMLRMREPAAVALRAAVEAWLGESSAYRPVPLIDPWNQAIVPVPSPGDTTGAFFASGRHGGVIGSEQLDLAARMREATLPTLVEGEPGDDLARGRGRYPWDDYELEVHALAQFHGWDEYDDPAAPAARLLRLAERLGRDELRRSNRRSRFGSSIRYRPLATPSEAPLWVAMLELVCADANVEPAPPALYADESAVHEALLALVVEHVMQAGLIDEQHRERVRELLADTVVGSSAIRAALGSSIDLETILSAIGLSPGRDARRSSLSIRELKSGLADILDPVQARAFMLD